MKSDFERAKAQDVINAVEARWQRQHDQAKKLARRGKLNGLFLIVLVIALAGGGYVAWQFHQGKTLENVGDLGAVVETCRKLVSTPVKNAAETEYANSLRQFLTLPVKLLKEMPAAEKPKQAAVGTVYKVLAIKGEKGFTLYRLTADGKGILSAEVCTPFKMSQRISWKDFRSQCKTPYLVQIGEAVYLSGSRELKEAERLRKLVHSVIDDEVR